MNIKSNFTVLILFALLAGPSYAQSTTINIDETETLEAATDAEEKSQNAEIDEKELPAESVTPKTDLQAAVLNKKLKHARRLAFDLSSGSILDEPLANSNYFNMRGSYYVNDDMSFGLGFRSRFGGKTSYSQQLYDGTAQLEFERAPQITSAMYASMGYNFFYGKMSLAKKAVITATTKIDSDIGLQKTGSLQKPFVQVALTQSFFFNNHFAVGISYGLTLAQAHDPTSVNIRSTEPRPNESDFALKLRYNQFLGANLTALF